MLQSSHDVRNSGVVTEGNWLFPNVQKSYFFYPFCRHI